MGPTERRQIRQMQQIVLHKDTVQLHARWAAMAMAPRVSQGAGSNGDDPLDPAAHSRASTTEAWRRSSAALAAKASRRSATRRLIVSGGKTPAASGCPAGIPVKSSIP